MMKQIVAMMWCGCLLLSAQQVEAATLWKLYSGAKTEAACLAMQGKQNITQVRWVKTHCLVVQKAPKLRVLGIPRKYPKRLVHKMYHLKHPLRRKVRMVNVPSMLKKAQKLQQEVKADQAKVVGLKVQTKQLQHTIKFYQKELQRLQALQAKKQKEIKNLHTQIAGKQAKATQLRNRARGFFRAIKRERKK